MNIKIFVINLDKDTERLDFMLSQFSQHNLEVNRFSAVTPLDLSAAQRDAVDHVRIMQKYHSKFHPWEVACAYSHKTLLEKIVQEKIPYALILEDDVLFDDHFFDYLNFIEKTISEKWRVPWEYLHCNYHIMDNVNLSRFLHETFIRITQSWFAGKFINLLKIPVGIILFVVDYLYAKVASWFGPLALFPIRPYYMAWAYFVTNIGAKKLLDTMNWKIIAPADIIQNIARVRKGLKLRVLFPQLAVQQEKFWSNLAKK